MALCRPVGRPWFTSPTSLARNRSISPQPCRHRRDDAAREGELLAPIGRRAAEPHGAVHRQDALSLLDAVSSDRHGDRVLAVLLLQVALRRPYQRTLRIRHAASFSTLSASTGTRR